jgi:hypothetical protein
LVDGYVNALHEAARCGHLEIVATLLCRGAVLESRSFLGFSALTYAALYDNFEVCLLLIARGADLRVVDNHNLSALSHYGYYSGIDLSLKALRVAELKKAWREGCHPSQVQRRKDENWAKRWPLMSAATGSGSVEHPHPRLPLPYSPPPSSWWHAKPHSIRGRIPTCRTKALTAASPRSSQPASR